MIGPILLQRIREIYRTYLKYDDFSPSYPRQDTPEITSFRLLLLRCLPPRIEKTKRQVHAEFTDLEMTVATLLYEHTTMVNGKQIPFSDLVFSIFCQETLPAVLGEAFLFSVPVDSDEEALLQESGYKSVAELRSSLDQAENRALLVNQLQEDLMAAWSERRLSSFFMRKPKDDGFLTWWPDAKTTYGRPLPTKQVETKVGTVTCEVQKYEEDATDLVNAYEWTAELRAEQKSELPDAVAYGMAYIFKRDADGQPYGGIDDLVAAADSIADTDVLQVGAFFEQHEDAEELLSESDVCFVWLWERRDIALKGAGSECLRAALSDLKRRFRKLRIVVVDVKPSQFISWTDETDYPQIELAKQQAIDAVLAHVEAMQIPSLVKGEMRPILNNIESDSDAALRVVGASVLRALGRGEGGDEEIDSDFDPSDEPYQMVCGLWLTPDFSAFKQGRRPKPTVSHSRVDFDALHQAVEDLFPYGPVVEFQVPNDTVDLVTLEVRSASRDMPTAQKYCRDFAHTLLGLAKQDDDDVLDVRPLWEGLHVMPDRNAAPPPVLLMFVVSAEDFSDAMIWFASAGTSFGLPPFDPLSIGSEYDSAGTLPPKFRTTLESIFGCEFEPNCLFERMCGDAPPPGFHLD